MSFDDDELQDTMVIHARDLQPTYAPKFVLGASTGPDKGRVFSLDPTRTTRALIGNGPACDLRLSDPTVSRRHAAIEYADKRLRITDLQSTNGTFVDGVSIVEAYVGGGEVVRLGETALVVQAVEMCRVTEPSTARSFARVVGSSAAMRRLYPLCERLASADVPVIIEGETGTGKEMLAEALHERSRRTQGPFVVFDCTAVAPSLIESELFGHEKGAFTGAAAMRRGVFERADGGTLLVDEIGDLPIELQAKLLRAIERSELTRVGGDRSMKVDVRVLAATRRDLDREVQEGRFRDDLFHRIAVTRIELPPLRRRAGDIAVLARHFAKQIGGPLARLPDSLLDRWESLPWPGNVRELRNAVARYLALGDLADFATEPGDQEANAAGAPVASLAGDPIARILALGLPLADARQKLLEEFEERYVQRVLEEHRGNVTRAAAAAGVARRHLQRLKRKPTP